MAKINARVNEDRNKREGGMCLIGKAKKVSTKELMPEDKSPNETETKQKCC